MTVVRRIAIAVAALALAAPAGATVTQRDAAEKKLVHRINQVRENHGLEPMRVATRLKRAATRHSNSMAKVGYFRHELRKDGEWKPFGTWIRWFWPGPGYASWSAGENLAWGTGQLATPRRMMEAWMNSPGHRRTVLNRAYREVGFGVRLGVPKDPSAGATVTANFGAKP